MRKNIFYNTVNFQPVTFRILFFRGIQTLQMRLSRKAWFWWTQLLRPFCRAADKLFYFHLVHCSFIFGHGWLHSNKFCKICKNSFCPSWCCLRCMMAFAGAFTTKQQFMHSHCIDYVYYDKALMISDSFEMLYKDYCWVAILDPIWTTNVPHERKWICYHPLITISWFFFSNLRDLGLNLGFLFFIYSQCIVLSLIWLWERERKGWTFI